MRSVRFSQSHPLQIASVSAGEGWGRVGITLCPGKKQLGAMTGAWDRDLKLDVGAIAEWGAVSVVSLIEPHELQSLCVSGLGEAVADAHMGWFHLPIRDMSVPDAAFGAKWATVSNLLCAQLRSGFNVLVHCKGGLGRAGIVASRILVDVGLDPSAALAAVRRVRPGAVETAAQERYVLSLTPTASPVSAPNQEAFEDRAIGALLGLATGDALGTSLEFSVRDAGPRITQLVGGGPFGLKAGEWTDDTAMALALAEALAVDPQLDEVDLMRRFTAWYRQGTYSCTGRCFDIGATTRAALVRFECTGDPIAGTTNPQSAGNGSLMRLAPVALRWSQNRTKLHEIAARQSRTTHGAEEAVSACVALAHILADAINGNGRDAVLAPRAMAVAPEVARVIGGSWRGKSRTEICSSGYVVHSLEASLWCVGRTASFADAIILAANLGNDADTVAAITGQLAGALYGGSSSPSHWLDKLAWRSRLETAAKALLP